MPLLLVVMPLLLVASYKCTSVYIDIPYLTSHPCNSFENLICGPDIVAIADRLNLPMSWCITCINKYIYIYILVYIGIYIYNIYIVYIRTIYIYKGTHTQPRTQICCFYCYFDWLLYLLINPGGSWSQRRGQRRCSSNKGVL